MFQVAANHHTPLDLEPSYIVVKRCNVCHATDHTACAVLVAW